MPRPEPRPSFVGRPRSVAKRLAPMRSASDHVAGQIHKAVVGGVRGWVCRVDLRYHAVLAVKVCALALQTLAVCGPLRTVTAALRRGSLVSGSSHSCAARVACRWTAGPPCSWVSAARAALLAGPTARLRSSPPGIARAVSCASCCRTRHWQSWSAQWRQRRLLPARTPSRRGRIDQRFPRSTSELAEQRPGF